MFVIVNIYLQLCSDRALLTNNIKIDDNLGIQENFYRYYKKIKHWYK